MKPIRCACVTIWALLGLACAARAEGLINNLPSDGSWVVLKVTTELDIQGNLQSIERELRIASVGQEAVDGKPARWLELSTKLGPRAMVAKLLIPEQYFAPEENPFLHVAKALVRNRDGAVEQVPLEQLGRIITFVAGVPHFQKTEGQGKQQVETAEGEYECDHLKGNAEIEGFQGMKLKVAGELWTSAAVPFGLVQAKITAESELIGITTDLALIRRGVDAKSELSQPE